MADILSYYIQLITLFISIFFALTAGAGLMNFYLRYLDRLPIDRSDVVAFARNAGIALLLFISATLFHYLPFFVALGFVLCALIVVQLYKLDGILKKLAK